jgi:hypothetical protein
MAPNKKLIVRNAELDHVIKTIFREDVDDPISLSCLKEGIDSREKLISLSSSNIGTMVFDVDEEVNNKTKTVTVPLPKGSKALLRIFKTYVTYELDVNKKNVGADWMTILYDDFNAYWFTSEASYRVMLLDQASASLVQQATTPLNAPHSNSGKALSMDPIGIFHRKWSKSIKRDTNAYTIFKEDHQWENWHREFTVTARSQQMDNILDDEYTPIAKSLDEAKFKQQQIYMYDVLNKMVKMIYGKEILRRHHNELNAQ